MAPTPHASCDFQPQVPIWWSAVDYSKWLGGPSISTACVELAMGLKGWGEDGWNVGWAVLKGGKRAGEGMELLSVDHHIGPGGLW